MRVSISRKELVDRGACASGLALYDSVSVAKHGRVLDRMTVDWDETSAMWALTSGLPVDYFDFAGLSTVIRGIDASISLRSLGWVITDSKFRGSEIGLRENSKLIRSEVDRSIVDSKASSIVSCAFTRCRVPFLSGIVYSSTFFESDVEIIKGCTIEVYCKMGIVYKASLVNAANWTVELIESLTHSRIYESDITVRDFMEQTVIAKSRLNFCSLDQPPYVSKCVVSDSVINGDFYPRKTTFVNCYIYGLQKEKTTKCAFINCTINGSYSEHYCT